MVDVVSLNSPFDEQPDAFASTVDTFVDEVDSQATPDPVASFDMSDWYSNYKQSEEYQNSYDAAALKYQREAEDEEDAFSGEFRGYGAGTGDAGYAEKVAGTDMFAQKITDSGVSRSIDNPQPFDLDYEFDYDTSKLYMKTPDTGFGNTAMWSKFGDIDAEEKKRLETGRYIDISGGEAPVGSYSMVWIENPPEPSTFEKVLSSPVLAVAGMINPVVALATTATKAASGMKVSPMEIASSLLKGLEMAGVVKPPVAFDNGEYSDALGGVDPFSADLGTAVADTGIGLFGSSYAQTQTALNVAAAGDAKGAAIALVGDNLIKGGLDKIGLDQAAIKVQVSSMMTSKLV